MKIREMDRLKNNVICKSFTFFSLDGRVINNVYGVELDALGEFSTIRYVENGENKHLTSDNFTYTNLILNIPSLGFAYCGDIIYLNRYREKPQEYVLQFGWHENVSNQKIYSWYLQKFDLDGKLEYNKTLYYDDLINILGIKNRTAGFISADLEAIS